MKKSPCFVPPLPAGVMSFLIAAALPLVLLFINARLLFSDAFLRFEYSLPNFPAEPYGMTQEERFANASVAVQYLLNDEPIDWMQALTFEDGTPMYNERELSHMLDVKLVVAKLFMVGWVLLAMTLLFALLLWLSRASRPALYRGLLAGSLLTALLIIAGLIAVATSFDWLFTEFHRLFFTGDSWIFLYSDTLIRVFPIRFWTDAFIILFGGALVESLMVAFLAWRGIKATATESDAA